MYEWHKQVQAIVDEIDECIIRRENEALTLWHLANKFSYSEFHTTRKFKEISGMQFRNYLRQRKLAFAIKEVRDSQRTILEIAMDYGFSSHEAFTRAFAATYGMSPRDYRKKPTHVVIRTKINPFGRYYLGIGEIHMVKSADGIAAYFATIKAHKLVHIKHRESRDFWDFISRQNAIPGQEFDTICALLAGIEGCLDGEKEETGANHQIMTHINEPDCTEKEWFGCSGLYYNGYGIRLAPDYSGEIPPIFTVVDVPEAEYLVFEHGPFDYEIENSSVEEKIENAISNFDFTGTGYSPDLSVGRAGFFYHHPSQFWKYIRPVKKK